jgi:nucleoside-diphosphate-sugar epimerase
MRAQLHVVMGGAGAIGRAVINALQERQLEAVAVERSKRFEVSRQSGPTCATRHRPTALPPMRRTSIYASASPTTPAPGGPSGPS